MDARIVVGEDVYLFRLANRRNVFRFYCYRVGGVWNRVRRPFEGIPKALKGTVLDLIQLDGCFCSQPERPEVGRVGLLTTLQRLRGSRRWAGSGLVHRRTAQAILSSPATAQRLLNNHPLEKVAGLAEVHIIQQVERAFSFMQEGRIAEYALDRVGISGWGE